MSASVETALRDRQKFASSHSDIPYVVALKIKSSHQWSSLKKVFLYKISQISRENTCDRVSFLIKL